MHKVLKVAITIAIGLIFFVGCYFMGNGVMSSFNEDLAIQIMCSLLGDSAGQSPQ
jgi:hypothetical protein